MRNLIMVFAIATLFLLSSPVSAQKSQAPRGARISAAQAQRFRQSFNCDEGGAYCTDRATHKNYEGQYIGHDEPALAFYSDVPGSGYSSVVHLTLPVDPTTSPSQDGTGGTFNFQTQGAFWFGMDLCDNQSAPAPDFNPVCTPDSDSNIFESTDVNSPNFVTIHPGTAVMELQFYAPGWLASPDPTHWLAAMTIDSFNFSYASFTDNNANCLDTIGEEPVNFAFITRSGVPQGPPGPLNQDLSTFLPDPTQTLFMNPGDHLIVFMRDTPSGFRVIIFDQTTKQFGWMTASAANGFAQVLFQPDPDPSNPSVPCAETPYTFRAMYATSSEQTRAVWTAHAMNISFASEIGHFEYCGAVDANGNCTTAGSNEPDGMLDSDDSVCGSTLPPGSTPFVAVAGCTAEDLDFDGVSYGNNWPGSLADPTQDLLLHGTPLQFTSLKFNGANGLYDYNRVAFETDTPANESVNVCDFLTGNGCVNPPPGAAFYPIFTTGSASGTCVWQFGGASIPGTSNTFGGNAGAEFGPLVPTNLPVGAQAVPVFNVFRQVLNTNPCP